MKGRLRLWIVSIALIAGFTALLRADDTSPPSASAQNDVWQGQATYAWFLEHYSTVAKDPEAMGVAAVYEADDLMKDQTPEARADFFKKILFDAKSRAVQRAIRMKLVNIYKAANRNDEAMQQLQDLITDTQ